MNEHTKYLQYLQENWLLLGAAQWAFFERKGNGFLWLKDGQILFGFYNAPVEKIKRVYEQYPIQTHIIVRFEDGFITAFRTPKPPQECFKIMKPQLNDFISPASAVTEI